LLEDDFKPVRERYELVGQLEDEEGIDVIDTGRVEGL